MKGLDSRAYQLNRESRAWDFTGNSKRIEESSCVCLVAYIAEWAKHARRELFCIGFRGDGWAR